MASRLFAVALLALALPVARSTAQCTDFSPGWGYPGNGLGATVRDLLSFDDGSGSQLYAAGRFPSSPPSLVRRWNGSSWESIGWAQNALDEARALEVYDHGNGPELYAAGKLTTLGTGPLANIARLVGSSWQTLGSGINGVVEALATFDDGSGAKLYVVGSFPNAGGLPAQNVARWNGSSWESAGSLVGTPHALAVHDDGTGAKLYVAGNLNAGPLQRWTGSAWSVVPGVTWNAATRWALATHDDGSGAGSCLYLGGEFSAPDQHLARWNGSQWLSMPGTLTGPVTALGVFREAGVERLFVAGPGSFNGSSYGRIARWDGAAWSPLGFGLGHSSGTVLTLQPHDDGSGERLYLGGSFVDMGGMPAHSIARFGDPCGAPLVTSQPQSVHLRPEQGTASTLVQFTVGAVGAQPVSYQWRKDGVPLSDTLDINGVTSPSLELARWTASTAGSYTCAVSNGVGTTYTQPAILSIPQGPAAEPWEYTPLLVPPRPIDFPSGATAVAFQSAQFASDGSAIVLGEIEQGGDVRLGRFSLLHGVTRVIATDGMQAPQCEPGASFFGMIASSVAPAAGGQVAFLAPLVGTTIPDGNRGIFHFDGTQLRLVARAGLTLPGLGAGETVKQLSFPGAADNGLVAFRANIFSGNTWVGSGLWSWTAGAGAQLELRTGQPAPGHTALIQSIQAQGDQVVTPDGRILVELRLDTNTGWKRATVPPHDALVLLGHPGSLQTVLQSGDAAPGFPSSCNLELPHSMLPTPDGLVVTSWIAGPGQFEARAMYRWQAGNLSLLDKTGDPVPGAPAAITMGTMTPLAVNANGDVAFETTYVGSCAGCGTRAICVRRSGTLQRIFDNGLALPPFTPAGMTPLSWTRAALDDRGRLVLHVRIGVSTPTWGYTLGWSAERGPSVIAGNGWQHGLPSGGTDTLWEALSDSGFVGDLTSSAPTAGPERFVALSLLHARGTAGLFLADFDAATNNLLGPAESICAGDGTSAPCPCGNTGGPGLGCANSVGSGAELTVTGSALLSRDDLTFQLSGVPPGVGALLFQTAQLHASFPALGDGLRCGSGYSLRLGTRPADPSGLATWGPALANRGGWSAGTSQIFQVWYRDLAGGPCGSRSNTSNALLVTFTP